MSCAEDGVGMGKAVWAHVYPRWLTKESRKSWERVWTEHGAQSVHGVQRRERRLRWRLGLPWPPAGRAPLCGALPHGVRVREPEEELPIVFVGGITHHQMLGGRIDIPQIALEDTRPVQGRAATRAKRLHGTLWHTEN